MKFVAAHNQQRRSFHVALNHLTDLTQEEVHAQRTGLRQPRPTQPQSSAAASSTVLSLSAEEARAEMQHPLPGPTDEIKARFDPFPRATPGHAECTYRLRDVKPPPAVDWRKHGKKKLLDFRLLVTVASTVAAQNTVSSRSSSLMATTCPL
jgi:hypothetical protein